MFCVEPSSVSNVWFLGDSWTVTRSTTEAGKKRLTPFPSALPLFVSTHRYFYLADPEAGNGGDKEAGELWAFAASVLPRIHECDADVAVTIRANTDITSSDAPVSEGYVFLKEKLESVYSCMGVSCSQVRCKNWRRL